MDLPCKLLHPAARLPTRATGGSAGLDLYAVRGDRPAVIGPGRTGLVGTGVAVAIPPGHYGQVAGRSGLASRGVFPVGGAIDCDYRGEIVVILRNESDGPLIIDDGFRIAQLLILPIAYCSPVAVAELDATGRGGDGFGSSGV